MSDSSPLLQHLDDLYPVARVLAGEANADALVTETYRRAAETPPDERPDDLRGWLIQTLLEVRRTRTDASGDRGPGDPFGREAARQAAERTMPVAFAACSAQERALLTLDVLGGATVSELGRAFDTSEDEARTLRDEARSALRAALRDSLTGPERMLVDVALREEEMREALRDVLTHTLHPTPPDLQADVASVLDQADFNHAVSTGDTSDPSEPDEAEDASSEDGHGESSDDTSSDDTGSNRVIDHRTQVHERSRRRRSRPLETPSFDLARGVVGVLVVVLLALGAYVLYEATAPAPTPDEPARVSVTDFAAQRAGTVETVLTSSDSTEVARYLDRTYDRRLAIPRIDGTVLTGVGILSTSGSADDADGEGPTIPALLYRDTTRSAPERGAQLTALAFTYASLDALDDRAVLDADLRRALEEERRITARSAGSRAVLLWRHRDDVFALVADATDPEVLRRRVR